MIVRLFRTVHIGTMFLKRYFSFVLGQGIRNYLHSDMTNAAFQNKQLNME